MASRRIPPLFPVFSKGPKPKGKKKIALGKFSPPPDLEKLDVLKVLLNPDAGADSFHEPAQEFEAVIKSLSKSQLSKLERKILRIKRQILDGDKRSKQRHDMCDRLIITMMEHIQQSTIVEDSIQLAIGKKLEKLSIQKIIKTSSDIVERLKIDDEWVTAKTFIDRYFADELEEIGRLIEEGILIPPGQQYGPHSFINRFISKLEKKS